MISDLNYINSAVVKAGSLVNGTGNPVRINVFLHVQDGRIASISGIRPDTGLPLVDLSEYTVLPGFIDCHVHLFMCAKVCGEARNELFSADYETVKPVISRHVDRHLRHGVVAVRDGGDAGAHAARYKTEHLSDENGCLCVRTAGRAFYKPGRYGKIIGGRAVNGGRLLDAVSRNMKEADHIKIINSGINSLSVFKKETKPQFQPEELKAIVRLAGKKKQKVMVHANGEIPVRDAIEAGGGSLEHGFFLGGGKPENQKGKKALSRETGGPVAPGPGPGGPIALGTDAGSPGVYHGDGIITELGLLLDAGYSVEEAIKCSSSNGAQLLGFNDLGFLSPGMPANFIAARGTIENIPGSLNHIKVFRPERAVE